MKKRIRRFFLDNWVQILYYIFMTCLLGACIWMVWYVHQPHISPRKRRLAAETLARDFAMAQERAAAGHQIDIDS